MRQSHERLGSGLKQSESGILHIAPVSVPCRSQEGNKGAGGISVRSPTDKKADWGCRNLRVRLETSGKKVRGTGREISQMQTDDRLWLPT